MTTDLLSVILQALPLAAQLAQLGCHARSHAGIMTTQPTSALVLRLFPDQLAPVGGGLRKLLSNAK